MPCDAEIIFADDGSTDETLDIIKAFARSDKNVRYVSLSRRFGKEGAMYAGLREARGDYAVVMDADLQHPPRYIKEMYEILTGTDEAKRPDSVAMYRTGRKGEKRFRSFCSKLIMKRMKKLSGIDIPAGATDFRMVNRQMLDAYLELGEYNRFSKGLFYFIGFDTKWMPYENVQRVAGKSAWSFRELVAYAMDAMLSFSDRPLRTASVLGAASCILALLFALYVVIKTIIWGDPVAGFPSLFCMLLFMGGSILMFLGILGRYISKIYLEDKKRPICIIKEKGGNDPDGAESEESEEE